MMAIMSAELMDGLSALPFKARSFATGQHLFHRGDPVATLFQVEQGTVYLQRFTLDGGAAIMQRAAGGALLAEASIFSQVYHCDAIATDPVRVRQFDIREVRRLIDQQPSFASSLAHYLAKEVMTLRSRSEIAMLRTVEARLDAWLALNEGQLPPSGKRVELARELGVSPEALYRELARRRNAL